MIPICWSTMTGDHGGVTGCIVEGPICGKVEFLECTVKLRMANFFLCYECGATFNARSDFDEHILVHQAVSLCYQIYEFDRGRPCHANAKAKEESQSVSSSKESGCRPQAGKLSAAVRKTSGDWPQRSARRTVAKRKLTDIPSSLDNSSKAQYLKHRKNSQNDAKVVKLSKLQDTSTAATVSVQSTHPQIDKELSAVSESKYVGKTSSAMTVSFTKVPEDIPESPCIDSVESQRTTPQKGTELLKTDVSMATVTTAAGATISFLSPTSSSATATRNEISKQDVATSATAQSLPKCLICDYRSSQGTDMVEHVVRVHKTSITSLERMDFVDGKWSEAIKLEPRQQCAYCVRTFREATDYFLHVIICHKRNLLSPGVSKYNCIVYLAHPGISSVKNRRHDYFTGSSLTAGELIASVLTAFTCRTDVMASWGSGLPRRSTCAETSNRPLIFYFQQSTLAAPSQHYRVTATAVHVVRDTCGPVDGESRSLSRNRLY
uniref:C2H2-type domain-containing protein n=1 Tax=Setaria digitata TaxID=48799 RepID=A0A915Q4T5_9BILA